MNPPIVLAAADLPEIVALLEAARLPVADLPVSRPQFLGVREAGSLTGVVGIEPRGSVGLLRSLVVAESHRGSGLGSHLVNAAEEWAVDNGIQQLYLLTTTAQLFFDRRGYRIQERADVHPAIQETSEFSSACPASAIVMRRLLKG